jgi:hypothetical protein
MNKQLPLDFFASPLYYVEERWDTPPVIRETTFGAFLREFCEGDPAQALYICEATEEVPVWHGPNADLRYDSYRYGSNDPSDAPDEWKEVTRYEVREGRYSAVKRDRLVDTFDTEEEAEEYLLNCLHWNYTEGWCGDTPYSAATREECDAYAAELMKNTSAGL